MVWNWNILSSYSILFTQYFNRIYFVIIQIQWCGTGIFSLPIQHYSPNILTENILQFSKFIEVEPEYSLSYTIEDIFPHISKFSDVELEYSLVLYYKGYYSPYILQENILFISWNIFFLYREYHSSNISPVDMLPNTKNTSSLIWNWNILFFNTEDIISPIFYQKLFSYQYPRTVKWNWNISK